MKKLWISATAMFSILILSASAFGQGKGATTITDSVDGNVTFNPCNGEGVMLSGSIQIVVREETDATGATHFRLMITGKGVSGVGLTTGIRYRATGPAPNVSVRDLGQGATVVTDTTRFHLISTSSADNFVVNFLFHVTINPNGDLTAEIFSDIPECRG